MKIDFTNIEREYITNAIILLQNSLDDICDKDRKVIVDFMSQEDADNEYQLIDSILKKVAGTNED